MLHSRPTCTIPQSKMLSICSSLSQPAPTCYKMLQPANGSFKMRKTNRPLVGQANMGSMPQVAIPDEQLRKAMKGTTLGQRRKATSDMVEGLEAALAEESESKNIVWTLGNIWNFTPGDIVTSDDHQKDWSGTAIDPCSSEIKQNGYKSFEQEGPTYAPDGSKGAVVYFGKSTRDSMDYDVAWLVAWHTPAYNGDTNKVYGECGAKNKYDNIDWEDIEEKLKGATAPNVRVEDPTSRAKLVVATIDGPPIAKLVIEMRVIEE